MDERSRHIIACGRQQLLRHPDASMADIASAAGVGMSAVYLRFANRDDLLGAIALDGLAQFEAITADALAADPPSLATLRDWMLAIVESGALTLGPILSGTFRTTSAHAETSRHAYAQLVTLLDRARQAGVLREHVGPTDVVLLLEGIGIVRMSTPDDLAQARRRMIDLALAGLTGQPVTLSDPLPHAAIVARWTTDASPAADHPG